MARDVVAHTSTGNFPTVPLYIHCFAAMVICFGNLPMSTTYYVTVNYKTLLNSISLPGVIVASKV